MKAGEFKDTGSPTRDMTPAEREYMQQLIDNMHSQFIHSVAEGRHMKDEEIRAIANGKVWTGQQAVPLKLVDQIGDFEACVKDTAKAVGFVANRRLCVHLEKRRTLIRLIVWRYLRLHSQPCQADGSARRILLPLEVAPLGALCSGRGVQVVAVSNLCSGFSRLALLEFGGPFLRER